MIGHAFNIPNMCSTRSGRSNIGKEIESRFNICSIYWNGKLFEFQIGRQRSNKTGTHTIKLIEIICSNSNQNFPLTNTFTLADVQCDIV